MRKKIVSLLAVTGLLVCMFGTVIGVRALSSNIDKIEGILGAPVGDVSESDVRDIVNMVNQILNVANAPHAIPDGCPDNIASEINSCVNFNVDGAGYNTTVSSYETILYGNGSFTTTMTASFNDETYTIIGTKKNGQINLSSMYDLLYDLGNINGNEGDFGGSELEDDSQLDEYEEYIEYDDKESIEYTPEDRDEAVKGEVDNE